jgi:hypothetical protein
MKAFLQIVCLLCFVASGTTAYAQSETDSAIVLREGQTYTQLFDSLTSGLIPNRVPYGVLYDRVMGFGNRSPEDTVSSAYAFFQAWWDMEHSRVTSDSGTYDAMRHSVDSMAMINAVPLLSIDYYYGTIDSAAMDDGRLSVMDGILTDNNLAEIPYDTGRLRLSGLPISTATVDDTLMLSFNPETFRLANTGAGPQSVSITDLTDYQQVNLVPGTVVPWVFHTAGPHLLKVVPDPGTGNETETYQIVQVAHATPITINGTDCNPYHNRIESEIAFQGYDEPYATTSYGDYHIYYHFTAPNSGVCEKVLRKPIIIMDGYDPMDSTSWVELYRDYLNFDGQNLGNDLRNEGYDIVILNFPRLGERVVVSSSGSAKTYIDIPSYVRKESGGSLVADPVSHNGRDGGTDYIERNAYVLVALMKYVHDHTQADLVTGEKAKAVVVGPSMGGQISRYALAYMEQQYALHPSDATWDHNTRLWVSFDSPHWGANIPVALQNTLDFFGNSAQNQDAKDAYYQQLYTHAGREMLIEQKSGLNNTETLRMTYMSSLANNGLSGSHGYPMQLRKIALLNGRGDGVQDYNPGILYADVRANQFGREVFKWKNWYMPNYNATTSNYDLTITIAPAKLWYFLIGHLPHIYYRSGDITNANPNGSMDVTPGSNYNSIATISNRFISALNGPWFVNASINTLDSTHTFIPTVSALGFYNPNFNWSTPINDRNLVCNNEIPFDNYYMPDTNEQHIWLTADNVAWLKEEIDKGGKNGCAGLPICTRSLTGSSTTICLNGTATYTLDAVPPTGTTTTWSVSNTGLQIVSSSSTSVTVQAISSGMLTDIIATINNPCGANTKISRTVAAGSPIAHSLMLQHNNNDCEHFEKVSPYLTDFYHYYWSDDGVTYTSDGETYGAYYPDLYNQQVWLKVTNSCGTYTINGHHVLVPQSNGVPCQTRMLQMGGWDTLQVCKVYPNPSSDAWHIALKREVANLSLTLTDINGNLIYQQAISDPNHSDITIRNADLPKGIYFMKVVSNLETAVYKLIKR